MQFMIEEGVALELKVESAVVLGSIAKGTEENIRSVIDAGAISVLFKGSKLFTVVMSSSCSEMTPSLPKKKTWRRNSEQVSWNSEHLLLRCHASCHLCCDPPLWFYFMPPCPIDITSSMWHVRNSPSLPYIDLNWLHQTSGPCCNTAASFLFEQVLPFVPEMTHQDLKYVEACLRCLRTIFTHSVAPTEIVYQVSSARLRRLVRKDVKKTNKQTKTCTNQMVAFAVRCVIFPTVSVGNRGHNVACGCRVRVKGSGWEKDPICNWGGNVISFRYRNQHCCHTWLRSFPSQPAFKNASQTYWHTAAR